MNMMIITQTSATSNAIDKARSTTKKAAGSSDSLTLLVSPVFEDID